MIGPEKLSSDYNNQLSLHAICMKVKNAGRKLDDVRGKTVEVVMKPGNPGRPQGSWVLYLDEIQLAVYTSQRQASDQAKRAQDWVNNLYW